MYFSQTNDTKVKQMTQILRYLSFYFIKGQRIKIPTFLLDRILNHVHQHYLDIVNSKGLLREKVWWKIMGRDVKDFIRSCHICRSSPP